MSIVVNSLVSKHTITIIHQTFSHCTGDLGDFPEYVFVNFLGIPKESRAPIKALGVAISYYDTLVKLVYGDICLARESLKSAKRSYGPHGFVRWAYGQYMKTGDGIRLILDLLLAQACYNDGRLISSYRKSITTNVPVPPLYVPPPVYYPLPTDGIKPGEAIIKMVVGKRFVQLYSHDCAKDDVPFNYRGIYASDRDERLLAHAPSITRGSSRFESVRYSRYDRSIGDTPTEAIRE